MVNFLNGILKKRKFQINQIKVSQYNLNENNIRHIKKIINIRNKYKNKYNTRVIIINIRNEKQ